MSEDEQCELRYIGPRNSQKQKHGRAVEFSLQERVLFRGHFCNGERHGRGTLVIGRAADRTVIRGTWHHDVLQGVHCASCALHSELSVQGMATPAMVA